MTEQEVKDWPWWLRAEVCYSAERRSWSWYLFEHASDELVTFSAYHPSYKAAVDSYFAALPSHILRLKRRRDRARARAFKRIREREEREKQA